MAPQLSNVTFCGIWCAVASWLFSGKWSNDECWVCSNVYVHELDRDSEGKENLYVHELDQNVEIMSLHPVVIFQHNLLLYLFIPV